MNINELLQTAVASGASDLHLKVGSYPMMRVNGTLVVASETKRLEREDTEAMAESIFTPDQREKFRVAQEVDLAYSIPGMGRFRCNVFQQRGTVGLVLRVIPTRIRTLDELGLPPVLKRVASEERGLVLVTGTTGSGKSTTLAAMIDYINSTRATHIMTLEDPIEYLHRDHHSIVNQREIAVDTQSFAHALRSALRQDPDVILVGMTRITRPIVPRCWNTLQRKRPMPRTLYARSTSCEVRNCSWIAFHCSCCAVLSPRNSTRACCPPPGCPPLAIPGAGGVMPPRPWAKTATATNMRIKVIVVIRLVMKTSFGCTDYKIATRGGKILKGMQDDCKKCKTSGRSALRFECGC